MMMKKNHRDVFNNNNNKNKFDKKYLSFIINNLKDTFLDI